MRPKNAVTCLASRFFPINLLVVLTGFIILGACSSKATPNAPKDPAVSIIETDEELFFTQPAWNPYGTSIAVVGATTCQGMCPYSIYAIDPQNGHTWQLVNKTAMNPTWTPDGRLSFYYEAPILLLVWVYILQPYLRSVRCCFKRTLHRYPGLRMEDLPRL